MRMSARQLLITYVPSLAILLIMAAAGIFFEVHLPDLTRDVAAIAEIHPLSGVLSNLGVLLWCAAASICLFSALTLRGFIAQEDYNFLLSTFLLSAYLMLDDFFLFHEDLAGRYLKLDEYVVFGGLGVAVVIYLVRFRRLILQSNYIALFLALGFLATSAGMDKVVGPMFLEIGHWEIFLEDGSKWLGIASWCSYCWHTCQQQVERTSALRLRVSA